MINFLGVVGIIGFVSLCLFCSLVDGLLFDQMDLK
jgi:hypothetical protein